MPDRVLIVDDEVSLARVLGIRLQAEGFEVSTAHNGEDGLADAMTMPPAAIVLDVRMPGLDGHEVHERLQADPRTARIPVVFLSANVQDAARETAMASGAAAYITKPYEPRDVIAVLRRAIESRSRTAS